MDVLCVFAVVFVVVTVVGHGIWVLLAWLSRAIAASDEESPPPKLQPCIFCGQPTPVGRLYCRSCNANLQSPEALTTRGLEGRRTEHESAPRRGVVAADEARRLSDDDRVLPRQASGREARGEADFRSAPRPASRPCRQSSPPWWLWNP